METGIDTLETTTTATTTDSPGGVPILWLEEMESFKPALEGYEASFNDDEDDVIDIYSPNGGFVCDFQTGNYANEVEAKQVAAKVVTALNLLENIKD